MGIAFIKSKPGRSNLKLQYLNFSWESLSQTKNATKFMEVGAVLVEFAIKNIATCALFMGAVAIFDR